MYRLLVAWVRRTLGISKTEINGYSVLLLLFIILHFASTRYPGNTNLRFEKDENSDSIWAIIQSMDSQESRPMHLSSFNPNTITYDSMISMGFLPQIAKNVVSYRKAGGKFNTTNDLTKIYGITDSLWVLMKPWVVIENKPNFTRTKSVIASGKKSNQQFKLIGINSVDSSWFQTIYGIGPVLSARIVKYRELLGGFVSLEQLNEVYGLSPEVIKEIKGKVRLDTIPESIKKLNINTDDYKTLGRHPYLTFKASMAIISYRENHGAYDNIEELKKIHLIDDSTYLRVSPYLDF